MNTTEITIVTALNPLNPDEGNVRLCGREIVQHFTMWQRQLMERILELESELRALKGG